MRQHLCDTVDLDTDVDPLHLCSIRDTILMHKFPLSFSESVHPWSNNGTILYPATHGSVGRDTGSGMIYATSPTRSSIPCSLSYGFIHHNDAFLPTPIKRLCWSINRIRYTFHVTRDTLDPCINNHVPTTLSLSH